MRHIGSLPREAQARLFADFLLSRGIRNEVEAESDNTWSVWIRDEDQMAEAQTALARFQTDPNAAEFHKATEGAEKVRQAEAEDLTRYRQRVRTRRSIVSNFGSYGMGLLTFALMMVCVYVAFSSKLGANSEWLRAWQISDPENTGGQFLPEVHNGEFWRLFTPIFIHYGLAHIVFNMLWFYQLGSMIEARQNALFLLVFIAVSAAISNVAEYYFHGPSFGGMSGVVYALAGYVWIRGKYDKASGLYLDRDSVVIMLVWLVLCFSGMMGHVANAAHLAGLIVGMVWGGIGALIGSRKPE